MLCIMYVFVLLGITFFYRAVYVAWVFLALFLKDCMDFCLQSQGRRRVGFSAVCEEGSKEFVCKTVRIFKSYISGGIYRFNMWNVAFVIDITTYNNVILYYTDWNKVRVLAGNIFDFFTAFHIPISANFLS